MKTKLIIKLLTALGFGAMFGGCDLIDIGKAEYGCPHADYEIKGKVTDADANPIKGIKLSFINPYDPEYPDTLIVGYTSAEGLYDLSPKYVFPMKEFVLAADDVDGADNGGEFASASEKIIFTEADYKDGESWYSGIAYRTVDFSLEKQD